MIAHDLSGKVALVTGGSRGIGRAIALAFADAKADVAVVATSEERAAPVAEECRARGVRALAIGADVADGAAAAAAVTRLARRADHGGVILIERALYDALPAPLRRQLRRDGTPILMPFPGPALGAAGPAPEEELLEILRQSVGYRLRLR